MKRSRWTFLLTLVMGAALSLQAQTLIHYTLNDVNTNQIFFGAIPNAGTLGPGTIGGGGIVLTNDIPTNGTPAGAGNRAIVCNGAGGVLAPGTEQLNNTNVAAAGGFTYEAWVKWNGAGNINAVIDYAGTQKLVWPSGAAGPEMETDNTIFNLIGSAAPGQWHYVAVVFTTNGPLDSNTNITGNYTFYLDANTPIGFVNNITINTFGDSLNRTIGVGMHPAGFSTDYFNGLIYEPRVTLGALPAASLLFQPFQVASSAPAYAFSALAGDSSVGSSDGAGDDARFASPWGIAVDTNGNVYVGDSANNTIRKITPAGVVSTWAGAAGQAGYVDGTIGVNGTARFNTPQGVALDKSGNLFVADSLNAVIRKITPSGQVSSLPGGKGSFVAVDNWGAVYGEEGFAILKFISSGTNWIKTTLAGSVGVAGYSNGPAATALFEYPEGLAVDAATNVYICDLGLPGIREITASGLVKTVAGSSVVGVSNGIGTNAQFGSPFGISIDIASNIYVGDASGLVRKIMPVGTNWAVSTFAGEAFVRSSIDGTGTNAAFGYPYGVAEDGSGNVYVADRFNNNIRKITSAGVVTTLAGPGNSAAYIDGTGAEARFNTPNSVAADLAGNIYVADGQNHVVRKITSAGVVSTLAGKAGVVGQQDGTGDQALFFVPNGVVTDPAGNIYVTDKFTGAIRKVTPAGVVSTIAGGAGLSSGGGYRDGPGGIALFNNPAGIAMDGAGNFYVADDFNNAIRLIPTNDTVCTVAGGFAPSYLDGNGAVASFNSPQGIAVDKAGDLYVAEAGNHDIRKIFAPTTASKTNAANWMVTTLAGVGGMTGSKDGTGADALFGFSFYNPGPTGVAIDEAGNLYITDDGNNTIRGISPAGVVSTLGGLAGVVGNSDGTGGAALFNAPFAIAVDSAGALYVSDQLNNTIRKGVFSAYVPANPAPPSLVLTNGRLNVTLLPPQAGGQWRFPWETAWRASGTTASNLAQGEYAVEFRNIPGYLVIPLSGPVGVTNGGTTYLTNTYYPTVIPSDTTNGGSLTVNIGPSPPSGTGWRFLGDTTAFYPPGYTTNLLNGTYLIQFAPVAGFTTPASLSVQVDAGLPTTLAVTYLLASSPPAGVSLPAPVPPGEITDLNDYPFGYNGQLQTDVGYGSGVAVATNVVLTAAHLIFNDQTLSFVSQSYWFYQQETGVFAPDPLLARGWFVLDGYASQRTNDVLGGLGPDQSSPQSRNMDVAALYFQTPVANGGSGGYLPSDAAPNTWLAGQTEKMLTGYPVDGSQFGISTITNGLMYETGPQTAPFGLATDPVTDQQVYTASWLLSFPGNSGGPLYVQYDGSYYPAGVYLGSLFNGTTPYASAVRAIDSNVVNLINSAASLGDTGTNFSGGGVITIIPSLAVNAHSPGYLLLQLGPPAAVQAGAAWKLASQSAAYYSTANPSLQQITSTNALLVQFKPIPGWNLPANLSITVTPNAIRTNAALYTATNPVLTLSRSSGLGITGTTNTRYQIQSNSSLASGNWVPVFTNLLTSPTFNLITNKPGPGFYRALWLTN